MAALALAGCVHTTVSRVRIAADTHKPYKKILVCSMSNQTDRVKVAEDTIVRRLSKQRVEAAPCHELFASANRSIVTSQIKTLGYDAVLVIYRAAGIAEENVDEATRIPYPSLDAVVKGYGAQDTYAVSVSKETVARLPGQGDTIAVGADLLDIVNDRVVWSNAGTVEGPAGSSLSDYAKSGADVVVERMKKEKMIR